jgi:NAD(P)-dependent dehydrogenase (short-subunit alcohol dehydrogenase family)
MAKRAALVTGASSGLGLAIAGALAEDGYGVTLVSRTQTKLEAATADLIDQCFDVQAVSADVGDPAQFAMAVAAHRARFGRLDVLVNNAGVGLDAPIDEQSDRRIDLQLSVDLRAVITGYRVCLELLKAAAAEHGNASVINMASVTGLAGVAGLSVYSAAKGGVIAFTQAMNRELGPAGIKSCALCPAYVDTALSDYVKDRLAPENMIPVTDVVELVRAVLRLSPRSVTPVIAIERPGAAQTP